MLNVIRKWCKERKRKRIEAELRQTHPEENPAQIQDIMNRIVDPLLDNRKIGSTKNRNSMR